MWSLADASCLPPLLADLDDLPVDCGGVVAPLCGLVLSVSAAVELLAPVAVVPDCASAAAGAFDFFAGALDMSAEGAVVAPLWRASVSAVPDCAEAGLLVWLLVCAMAGKPAVRSAARATPLSRCFIMVSFLELTKRVRAYKPCDPVNCQ